MGWKNYKHMEIEMNLSLYEDITHFLKDDLHLVNEKIFNVLSKNTPLLQTVTQHLLQAGGKRIRPILTLLCARLCQYKGIHHTDLAAALELIHMATLLHDDVIDQSTQRRHIPCAHTLWGNKTSILVGDYLFSHAFQTITHAKSLPILEKLSYAATAIAEGEIMQITMVGNLLLPPSDYFTVIGLKTASLLSACCSTGALLGNGIYTSILEQYGYALGIIFQLADDLLDYSLENNTMGKLQGNDWKEKKATLPLLWAYKQASAKEKSFLETSIKAKEYNQETYIKVKKIMQQYDIHAQVRNLIKEHRSKVINLLKDIPTSTEKSLLLELSNFCAERIS